MNPVCVECKVFFRRSHNGVYFIEGMPGGVDPPDLKERPPAKPGTDDWAPYKLWAADEFECPECHTKVLGGYSQHPLAEHFESGFATVVDQFKPYIMVNDCA